MAKAYDSDQAASSYNKARLMPSDTMAQWMNLLLALVPAGEVHKTLDLGCGTGRFSFALSDTYKCPVLAVDPSDAMLQEGRRTQEPEQDVTWLKGSAEEIPAADGAVDLVWMSQVFHHLDDYGLSFQEIFRVLTKAGYLAIRNGMLEHIDEIVWYGCFPEAAEIERRRLLSQTETVELVTRNHFRLCTAVRHYQYFAQSYHEYADKICGRGLSSLIAISDDAFDAGVRKLKKWVEDRPQVEPVFEPVDLLVFRKA